MPVKAQSAAVSKDSAANTGIRFAGLATRVVAFQELQVPPETVTPPAPGVSAEVNMKLLLGIAQLADNSSGREVTLDATLTPDPAIQPYKLRVVVSALFAPSGDATDKALDEFCQKAAPTIIWPYLRSLVSSVTADARYGPLRLDPINLNAFIKDDGWHTPGDAEKEDGPKLKR